MFASDREGVMQIYVMNSDGSGLARLTNSGANDSFPRWSPNGTKILFQSDRDYPDTGYNDIYVMNSDGSGVTRLTSDANDDSMANWSPDGSKIIFQSFRNGVNYQVYSMNADGSGQVCLTNTSSNDGEPSWSPDGAKIAFASDRDHPGTCSVYVMNSNGTGQQRLTFSGDTFDDRQPAWSRDGAKIVFVSTRDSVTENWTETDDYEIPEDDGRTFPKSRVHINKEIYVMNADGSSQLRLTNDLANDDAPAWSPDGSKIVFRSDRERDCCDPSAQIWTMNADGSGQTDVSNDGTGNYTASWTNSGNGNLSPVADAGGTYSGTIAQNVPFHGNNSYDPDGSIASYSWNFGDGGSSSGINPTHAYAANGSYTVTLTVTDNLGAQATVQTTANISTSSSDQFAQNFLYWGLGRTPNGDESGYWSDIMRAAYPQGQTSMLMAMKEFGMTVFDSAEYAGRNRSNRDYVNDLYRTYLMRAPESCDPNDPNCGPNFWTRACDSIGREAVRQAFDESGEFHDIVASLSTSGEPSSAVSSLATAQVDPFNQSGNQIQARDCEWSVPLISLPGRAGLDLGLSLSYSSLVWSRSGPYMYFDQDYESLSPGFTIGFPTVQWRKFDARTGRNVYILTAAGRHTELRQVGSTNIYEAADSSYLQLIDYGGSLALRTTDGTELSFTPLLNGYNVTQIKDRNGNFITVENDWRGDIQHITDTVNRTIAFNYDANANLNSITQTGLAQPWATFRWGSAQIQPTFGEVVGTYAGENILALNFVSFADGSYTRFNYNGYAQVREIKHFASDSNADFDNHLLNTSIYNYDASDDGTRLTDMRISAENWTGANDVPSQVITQFSASGDAHQMTVPDGTIYKEFYGGTGSSPVWQRGLVISTQVLTGSTVQKTTTSKWAQDDQDASYQTNPRVYQTDVSDGTNHRKTTIGYQTFTLPTTNASCSLPSDVYEYDSDESTVLRRTHTDYVPIANYINDYRRIIGLPMTKLLYEGMSTLKSKTGYEYDDQATGFMQNTASPAIQHDESNYSADFVVGRGNVTKVIRWDVDDTNQTAKTENKVGYDITGNVIFTRDALDHQTSITYADAFSFDGTVLDTPRSFATFAYPTTISDADGHSSTLRYRYDFGAKTRAEGPPPGNPGQYSTGIIQTISYDDAARVQRVTSGNTGAYTHYAYGPNFTQTFSSVNNVATVYWQSDAYAIQVVDGAGHVIYSSGNHPGSVGGYRTVSSIYDLMGRLAAQSNPTEITGERVPAGDDDPNNPNGQGHGFVYTHSTYDWKGRPLLTINPSTTANPNEVTYKEASYEGCGCAGGEVVTLTDEGTVINGQNVARRQKIYSDVLGRQWKTEVLNWDGSVYSSTVSIFNARDQVKVVNQYAGLAPIDASSTNDAVACPTGACQQTTMAYDGYGRLRSKHVPEQRDPSNNLTYTTWTYKPDDTIERVTDGRGASATYIYNNNRHLVNEIHYSAPSGTTPAIEPTSNVTFSYDAAGNRTSMSDGSGTMTYSYDQLSRLRSDSKTFSGLGGPYTIGYDYNLAGELKSITDPFSATINYSYDSVGRLADNGGVASVTGSSFGGVTTYASSIQYRAFNQVKSLTYGNAKVLSASYDNRMMVSSYEVSGILKKNYQRYDDGAVSFVQDQLTSNSKFDRSYTYDHLGRVTTALSGAEARGGAATDDRPYNETLGYDAMGHLTTRAVRQWNRDVSSAPATFVNNRSGSYSYDADGKLTGGYVYDAAGSIVSFGDSDPNMTDQVMDGDGRRVKTTQRHYDDQTDQWVTDSPTYYLNSTVLGSLLTEVTAQGGKQQTYVYANGSVLAEQTNFDGVAAVTWEHREPERGSIRGSDASGQAAGSFAELDPLGANAGTFKPFTWPAPRSTGQLVPFRGLPEMGAGGRGCMIDGIEQDCYLAAELNKNGAADGIDTGGTLHSPGSVGDTPIHGRFCVTASSGGKVVTTCTTEITGYVSVGALSQQPQKPLVTPAAQKPNTEDLMSRARGIIKKSDGCAKYLDKLMAKASQQTRRTPAESSILDILTDVDTEGRVIYGDTIKKYYGTRGATTHGSIQGGNAQIELPTPLDFVSFQPKSIHDRMAPEFFEKQAWESAFTLIHESFHLAGYNDGDLMRAAAAVAGVDAPDYSNLPSTDRIIKESIYWDDKLKAACHP